MLSSQNHRRDVKYPLSFPKHLRTLRKATRAARTSLFSPGCPVGSNCSRQGCCCQSGLFNEKQPKPDPPTVQPDF
ncbi:hypothetical protein CDL15_Pgr016300 [Punica granatum]|uniref:Uncharacterized protein n=1 Tax=Punica granatum TaxID=22663 RepID=A0A218W707_PUNGR|nr:hypothetical protein CDL15_Pgr016300 [Punica granatum]